MFLDTRNARIRFKVWGEKGDWVTLINGHTRSLSDFNTLARYLMMAGFRVLSLDNRGSGETEYTGPISINDFSEDVVALWDCLEISSTGLLGISMGGGIAQILAVHHSKYVNKLVLVSTCTGEAWSTVQPPWGESYSDIYTTLLRYFSEDFRKSSELVIKSMANNIFMASKEAAFIEKAADQRAAINDLISMKLAELIEQRTLVIHGCEDLVIGHKDSVKMTNLINDAQLKTYEGTGHLLLAESSARLCADVIGFF